LKRPSGPLWAGRYDTGMTAADREGQRISLIIPALNEESSLPLVLEAIPYGVVDEVIVADNGSTDGTAKAARSAGARVAGEPRRGYGSACLAGVSAARDPDIYVFMDGDNSDDPSEIPLVLEPVLSGRADLVIGSRILGERERGALLPQARWGNALAGLMIRVPFGHRVTDLGPFRAISAAAFRSLGPDDTGYGFPVQTQVRAIARGMRVVEVPVSYRRRIGRSKISGTLKGTILAGWAIISTILRERLRR
jgi:glycosyltransferase involved in cell wall biosynthesis